MGPQSEAYHLRNSDCSSSVTMDPESLTAATDID